MLHCRGLCCCTVAALSLHCRCIAAALLLLCCSLAHISPSARPSRAQSPTRTPPPNRTPSRPQQDRQRAGRPPPSCRPRRGYLYPTATYDCPKGRSAVHVCSAVQWCKGGSGTDSSDLCRASHLLFLLTAGISIPFLFFLLSFSLCYLTLSSFLLNLSTSQSLSVQIPSRGRPVMSKDSV